MKKVLFVIAVMVLISCAEPVDPQVYNMLEESGYRADSLQTELHKAQEIIKLQQSLIDEIETHCWENHDCDLPWRDSGSYDHLKQLQAKHG